MTDWLTDWLGLTPFSWNKAIETVPNSPKSPNPLTDFYSLAIRVDKIFTTRCFITWSLCAQMHWCLGRALEPGDNTGGKHRPSQIFTPFFKGPAFPSPATASFGQFSSLSHYLFQFSPLKSLKFFFTIPPILQIRSCWNFAHVMAAVLP